MSEITVEDINNYLNSVINTVKKNYGNTYLVTSNPTIDINTFLKKDSNVLGLGKKTIDEFLKEYEKDFKLTVKSNFDSTNVTKAKQIYVSMKIIRFIITEKKVRDEVLGKIVINKEISDENDQQTLRTKFLYDIQLELMKEYSEKVAKYLTPPPAATVSAEGGGSSDKKKKKVKGGFIDLDYDTQKMYNAQGLITELASLNAPSGNMNLNQPDPFSASGPSAGAAFETLPPNMIAGLTPNFSGGAKKSKKNLKHKRI